MSRTEERADKLRAEWFWVDRWVSSSAFLLPVAARGLYREMLSQAWIRDARLPNDHAAIQRATGVSAKEWAALWPKVAAYWRVEGDWLVNDTQVEIYREALRRADIATSKARSGADARWKREQYKGTAQADAQASTQADAQADAQALPEQCPPSLSPIRSSATPQTDAGARRMSYRDPHGMRTDLNAAASIVIGAGQIVGIPVGWWTKAKREYGLTDADLDAVVASMKAYVQRHGFEDGGKRLPWLDARLADFRQERAKPNDGYRPASEWIAERQKRDAEIPEISAERRRELLRPVRTGQA